MRAIEVLLNEEVLCVAGDERGSMLTVHLDLCIDAPGTATLRVAGMNELSGDRASHTNWLEEHIVRSGDMLRFRFFDSMWATPLASEVATDSDQYLADQAWYEGTIADGLPSLPDRLRAWPSGTLSLSAPMTDATATFADEGDFIALSILWGHPSDDYCRYSLSSFSQAQALGRADSKKWASGKLQLGEFCQVRIGA